MRENLRVLVVEDEILLSMMLEEMLDELGALLVGSVKKVGDALDTIRSQDCDCVLLDMNLGGERADEVAQELKRREIPFAILSGGPDISKDHGAATFVPKPYKFAQIEKALAILERELKPQE